MNDPALFAAGVVVTLIVVTALGLLVWGAILDGREEARQRALRRHQKARSLPGRAPNAAA